MKPQLLALLTATAWGIGGYFEKRGLHYGHLSPQVGITLRTVAALVVLAFASLPQWNTIPRAGARSLLYMLVGGGVLAGAAGMLCFYAAIKGAPLVKVMPIAFTAPLFSALMGIAFGGEVLTVKIAFGMLMTVGGIVLLSSA